MTSRHEGPKTETQEWVARRAGAVRAMLSAHEVLVSNGVELSDESTDYQVFCPFHDNKNTPAARYYSASGQRNDHFYCFKCKLKLDSISLYARFKNVRFMEALEALERRFKVRIPKRPDGPPIEAPADRGSGYVSDQWRDVPRVLTLLETKVVRARERCGMEDYVKFCRVLDVVGHDFDKLGKATPEMFAILQRLRDRVDEVIEIWEAMREFSDPDDSPPC